MTDMDWGSFHVTDEVARILDGEWEPMTDLPFENSRPIKRWLESRGAFVVNLHGGVYSVGLPDLIACYRGHFIAIEVKRPGAKPRKLQTMILRKITNSGGVSIVATTIQDVRSVIECL